MEKFLAIAFILLSASGALAAFAIFQTTSSCGSGNYLVVSFSDCTNKLTTDGADPLTAS